MRTSLVAALLTLALSSAARAELVANWNFNSYNGDDKVIASDRGSDGSATLTIDSGWPVDDLSAQTGTALNAYTGDAAGDGIQFLDSANNGLGVTMEVDLTALHNPVLSFAYKRPGNGFDDVDLFYSLDNIVFTKFADVDNPDASYAVKSFDFSSIHALDGAPSVFFRLLLSGAANQAGTADFDNIQVNAIPEPASFAMMGLGGCVLVVCRRRRNGNDTSEDFPSREDARRKD